VNNTEKQTQTPKKKHLTVKFSTLVTEYYGYNVRNKFFCVERKIVRSTNKDRRES
jgi:hypothetical protein